jgi:hypothetical protein
MIAFVAIKRVKGAGASFAYLPNTDITLPTGWEWLIVSGEVGKREVSEIGDPDWSLEDRCRLMCDGIGIKF